MNEKPFFHFRDDAVFCKVLEQNPDIAKKILILAAGKEVEGLDLNHVTIRRQEIVDPNLDARSIRLDVYMASSDFYADFEMQTSPEIYPLRSRFYISLNDADKLKKGETFKKLPKAIIIFICTNDPFHKGYAKYISKERLFVDDDCTKDITETAKYDAKYAKIYLNTKYRKDTEHQNVCEELANLLGYVETSVVTDQFTEEVDYQVQYVNKTEGEYLMTLYEKLQAERAEGIEQGIKQGKIKGALELKSNVVKNMKDIGFSNEQIAQSFCISVEEVQEILEEIGN